MPNRVAISTLNASTIDIINTIRANASYEYQSLVPAVTTEVDIPKVGEVLYGYPALANQFINALVNRIAAVRVKSALFNNPYEPLKKGYLAYGETIEEVFVKIAKAVEFSAEKAEDRELKRTLPDVRSAFHVMNYRVMYPITIQEDDLQRAFLSADGVSDMIERIVDAVYVAQNYDEFLLFKYLIIKAVAAGKMYPVAVDVSDMKNAAVAFRGTSNMITFMSQAYNAAGVHTVTPREDQVIFMDAMFNAGFDVNVLASAFNMSQADFMGRLQLIDRFDTFDNDRFDQIRAGSDQIAAVTDAELALMSDVVAVLVDREWFQVYDNNNKFTEKVVASGLYWNYFYHIWKTVSSSPFSNAIVFVKSTTSSANLALPDDLTITIDSKDVSAEAITFGLSIGASGGFTAGNGRFVQTEDMVEDGIAIQPYGAVTIPIAKAASEIVLVVEIDGSTYTAGSGEEITGASDVGDTVTLDLDT